MRQPPTPDRPRQGPARLAHPSELGWREIWTASKRVALRIGEDQILLISAGIAFFGLLALFPALTALVAITGLILDPTTISDTIAPIVGLMPPAAASIILDQIRGVAETHSGTLELGALLALALALFSASRGTGNLIAGLNVAYDEAERRSLIHLTFLNLGLTVFIVTVLVAQLALVSVVPPLFDWMTQAPVWEQAVRLLRWPFLFASAMATLSVLYRFGPCRRRARWRWIAPGTALACLMWVAGTLGFTIYVDNFGTYNETFGALGGVIVLLTWLWLTALTALIGAVIDAELEEQMTADTTVGAPRPAGARGAVKADRIPRKPR